MKKEDLTVKELLKLYKIYLRQGNKKMSNVSGYHTNEHDNSGATHPNYHVNQHDNTPGRMKLKK